MKICWDNLDRLDYRNDKSGWYDKKWGTRFYIYKEKCRRCGYPFLAEKYSKGIFCDHFCANTDRYCSIETRLKLSKLNKGKNRQGFSFYGKNHSNKTKQKMRDNHSDVLGHKNPNWKGGISCEPYCDVWLDKDFKESIKERDAYQCLNPTCSKENKRLNIHHINYIKKDCRPNNLITLCVSCNSKANFDRVWHKAWYSTIIQRRYRFEKC